jgi:hypothetical protein
MTSSYNALCVWKNAAPYHGLCSFTNYQREKNKGSSPSHVQHTPQNVTLPPEYTISACPRDCNHARRRLPCSVQFPFVPASQGSTGPTNTPGCTRKTTTWCTHRHVNHTVHAEIRVINAPYRASGPFNHAIAVITVQRQRRKFYRLKPSTHVH